MVRVSRVGSHMRPRLPTRAGVASHHDFGEEQGGASGRKTCDVFRGIGGENGRTGAPVKSMPLPTLRREEAALSQEKQIAETSLYRVHGNSLSTHAKIVGRNFSQLRWFTVRRW